MRFGGEIASAEYEIFPLRQAVACSGRQFGK
jgi:hypothetical protein